MFILFLKNVRAVRIFLQVTVRGTDKICSSYLLQLGKKIILALILNEHILKQVKSCRIKKPRRAYAKEAMLTNA
jgi:hypothetical protein